METNLDKVKGSKLSLKSVIELVGLKKVIEQFDLKKVIELVGAKKVIGQFDLKKVIDFVIDEIRERKGMPELLARLSPAEKAELKRLLEQESHGRN